MAAHHPAVRDTDLQYAMESAYTSEAAAPTHARGGDAYSQSLDPPAISSFTENGDETARATANDGAEPNKLNAEESAALRSFLAGGDESGEGVVLDWGVVLPLAQACCLALAFVVVIAGLTTATWKVGTAVGGHRASVGLTKLVLLDVAPKSAGTFRLTDVCKGLALSGAVAGASNAAAMGAANATSGTSARAAAAAAAAAAEAAAAALGSPMDPDMACAFARAGAAVNGLAGTALALLLALALTNIYFAFAARGTFAPLQPFIRPLETHLARLPPAARDLLPAVGWAASLFFLALALVIFGSAAPAGVGVGAAPLGLSFGAVRLGALFVCLGAGVYATSLSEIWRTELLAGISVVVAKWRALTDRPAKVLVGVLYASIVLHLLLWTRAVDWAVTLPCLGIVALLFHHTKSAMAFCVLTSLCLFFEVVDVSADGYGLAKGAVWLQVITWLLMATQLGALGGMVQLRIRHAQN
ncbi:hypothetical protein KFE25_011177 [Diacronema lutheri]|uniref:Uncharacterized protein n=1 Tax=Diacronema lutheri TaxID=2081491 RepID=A0A8J5XPP6_DIALT|nr:hypothetical protein KFE25_011177 [Diacronema lutheri]